MNLVVPDYTRLPSCPLLSIIIIKYILKYNVKIYEYENIFWITNHKDCNYVYDLVIVIEVFDVGASIISWLKKYNQHDMDCTKNIIIGK